MGASIIRTVVLLVVGYLLTMAAKVGLDLPEGSTTELVQVVVTGVYYMVFRWAEQQWPAMGRIFLSAGLTDKQPTYRPPASS